MSKVKCEQRQIALSYGVTRVVQAAIMQTDEYTETHTDLVYRFRLLVLKNHQWSQQSCQSHLKRLAKT